MDLPRCESRRIPMGPALSEAFHRHPRQAGSSYVFVSPRTGQPYDNIHKTIVLLNSFEGKINGYFRNDQGAP